MRNLLIRILSFALSLVFIILLMPTSFAQGDDAAFKIKKTDEFWEIIEQYEQKLDFDNKSELIADMYEYVSSLPVYNLSWEDADTFYFVNQVGVTCVYDYDSRKVERDLTGDGDNSVTVYNSQKGAGSSKDVFLAGPFYGYDNNFTDYYRNLAQTIANATGGSAYILSGTSATPAAIRSRLAQKKDVVCLFDSHGVSLNNTSYLQVRSSEGITSSDFSNNWAISYSSGVYGIDGRFMTNGQTTQLSNCFMWFASCEGMTRNGLSVPFVNCGAAAVYGYSKSVSFSGDYAYAKQFWPKMLDGYTVADSIAYMKQICGNNDNAGIGAYPIVVSPEDPYPSNVNTNQTVHCSWTLFSNNVYYITYNANGGKNEPPKQKLETTEGVETVTANLSMQVPYKFPYTFDGWCVENNGVADYQPGQEITVKENMTLYAAWFVSDKIYTNVQSNLSVRYADTYEYRKLIVDTDGLYNFVNSNDYVTISLLTLDGEELATGSEFECELSADNSYYISFTAGAPQSFILNVTTDNIPRYTLSYSAEGAENVAQPQKGGADFVVTDVIPTRFPYNFEGWSLSENSQDAQFRPGDVITLSADTTLYAVWSDPSIVDEKVRSVQVNVFYGADRYCIFRAQTDGKVTFSSDTEIIICSLQGIQIGQGTSIEVSANAFIPYVLCVKAIKDTVISIDAENNVLVGDVNFDGKINTADATVLLKFSAGIMAIDKKAQLAADVNCNGFVNTADAVLILKYAAGMIDSF